MAEPKIIYCPKCKRKVFSIYGKTTMQAMGICKKCNKAIHYDPNTEIIKVDKVPPRATSSGMTFY